MLTITTCQTYPEPPANLLPLRGQLQQRGIDTVFEPWQNRPHSEHLLPLCAWDYAAQPQAFLDWLANAACSGSRFANPPQLMRWNSNKRYLLDLAVAGAPVLPAVVVPPDAAAVAGAIAERQWQQAVIKPVIGQSGLGVQKIEGGQVPDLSAYTSEILLQPYFDAVAQEGETCLIFFNGRFSHAALRRPPVGEFRANSAYGARVSAVQVGSDMIAAAADILAMLPETPLYARLDGTVWQQRFYLNEVELIEPALYLHTDAGATARFADTLAAWIGGSAD